MNKMIRISRPYIEDIGEKAYLKSNLSVGGGDPLQMTIWYCVERKYRDFLVTEVADAFVLATLYYAINQGLDIESEAPLSEKFLFHLNNGLIQMLSARETGIKMITVFAESSPLSFDSSAVATGCSLGVDSLSAIFHNLQCRHPNHYKLTHLVLSNVGHHGNDDTESARRDFYDNLVPVRDFAKEVGLDLVWIDSNISDLYRLLKQKFVKSVVVRTLSAPMCLQKLFGKYFMASARTNHYVDILSEDSEDSMGLTVPLMSSNSLEMIVADPMLSRTDKIRYIHNNPLTRKYLDVCWFNCIKNMNKDFGWSSSKEGKNCGKCGKCMRTLLTFEVLGIINDYKDIFDLEAYHKHRIKYLIKVIAEKDRDKGSLNTELYLLIREKKFSIPFYVKCCALLIRMGVLKIVPRSIYYHIMSR